MQLIPKLAASILWTLGGCEMQPTPYHMTLPDVWLIETPWNMQPHPYWRKI